VRALVLLWDWQCRCAVIWVDRLMGWRIGLVGRWRARQRHGMRGLLLHGSLVLGRGLHGLRGTAPQNALARAGSVESAGASTIRQTLGLAVANPRTGRPRGALGALTAIGSADARPASPLRSQAAAALTFSRQACSSGSV
jgi:hypothetical protein